MGYQFIGDSVLDANGDLMWDDIEQRAGGIIVGLLEEIDAHKRNIKKLPSGSDEQADMLRQAYIHMRSAEEATGVEASIINTNMAYAYATIAQAEAATRQAEAMERAAESLAAIYKNGIG